MATATKTRLSSKERAWIKKLHTDLPYYSKNLLRIRTKQATLAPLDFNKAQRIAHEKISKQLKDTGRVRAIILKARQKGLSTYTAARFFRRCHLMGNQKAAIVADQKDKGSVLFQMYERFLELLPPEVAVEKEHNAKGNFLSLHNKSEIVVDTAGDISAGRGSTIQSLHLSEVAFWGNAEDVYVSLIQTVPDLGSEVVIESTANGVGNFFHRMWLDATEGRNGYIAIFLPWWIHEEYQVQVSEAEREEILKSKDDVERKALKTGFEWEGKRYKLTPEQLAWRRRTIQDKCAGNERIFRQEYPATAKEAFLVSGACFFDEEALEDFEARGFPPVRIRGSLVRDGNTISISRNERGWLQIWHPPHEVYCPECHDTIAVPKGETPFCPECKVEMRPGMYVIGADAASGKEVAARDNLFSDPDDERGGRDFCSADVIEVRTNRQVAHLHARMAPEVFAEQLALLGQLYGTTGPQRRRYPALLGCERNHSSGETVIRELQTRHRYPNLYSSRQMNTRLAGKPTVQVGWMTTKTTRMPMLDELASHVRNGTITINNPATIGECYTFVRAEDGKPQAQEGAHDDRVISLAVALQVGRSQPTPQQTRPIPKPEWGNSPTGWTDYD